MVSLLPNRFANYEFKNKSFSVSIPTGITVEQMLEPAYWMHVARHMSTGDEIKALAEDNTFYVTFVVVTSSGTGAVVKVTNFTELSKEFSTPAEADSAYEIYFTSNYHKWRVSRKADKVVLAKELPTRDAAIEWLKNYRKALTIPARKLDENAA